MQAKRRLDQHPGRARRALTAALIALVSCAAGAQGQLQIARHAIAGGGMTAAAGATCTLGATIGQHDASTLGGGAYLLQGGLWLGGGAVSGIAPPDAPAAAAAELRLIAGAPNPFFLTTQALLDLPRAQRVRVSVYDNGGRLVRRLCDQVLPAGHHQIPWTGRDATGASVASGIYLMRIETEQGHVARSVVLLGHGSR
jgi:hypothetical protein